MRGGPGLGNIAPSQSDYFQATRCGHGDFHTIVLAPASVQESYDIMGLAFEKADLYRTPVTVLSDGMLGQMMEPITLGDKIKTAGAPAEKPWALTGCKGRPPNIIRSIYLKEGALEEFNLVLQEKYALIRKKEQRHEGLFLDDAAVILVAYGSMARIAKDVVSVLRSKGLRAGLIRPVTLWPFPADVFKDLLSKRRRRLFFVTEMAYGQMVEDVRLAVMGKAPVEFFGRAGGGIPNQKELLHRIMRKARGL